MNWDIVGDVLTLVLGGALGVAGKTFAGRNRRRNMRKHLYKEMAFNYEILHHQFEASPYTELAKGQPLPFTFEYYRHAKKDLDLFHDLPESNNIINFYNYLEAAVSSGPSDTPGPVANCMWAYGMIHNGADDKRFNAKLLLRQASPYGRMILERKIKAAHEERAEMGAMVNATRAQKELQPEQARSDSTGDVV
jgi:hypothetical protein